MRNFFAPMKYLVRNFFGLELLLSNLVRNLCFVKLLMIYPLKRKTAV